MNLYAYLRRVALACAVLSPLAISAIPSKPGLITYDLPNGETISVYLHGDETAHYYTTPDGYVLSRGEDGYFRYVTVGGDAKNKVSEIIATEKSRRTLEETNFIGKIDRQATLRNLELQQRPLHQQMHHKSPRAFSNAKSAVKQSATYPTTGVQKGVAILVEFSNNSFTLDEPRQKFDDQLNKIGYNDFGATGSVKDYFMASSMGQFVPEFDVFGPVKLSQPYSYYGGDNTMTTDANAPEMIIEACSLLDGQIDFTQYDRDGDGAIDNVYVFYAGYGQADGGEASTVWPHSWDIRDAGRTFYFDGVQLGHYACSSELRDGRGQSISGIGVFCHEFTHVLGFPDLYATQYTGAFTPQAWTLMDSGSYNNNSWTPPYMSAYERYCMNWTEPIVLDDPANISMGHVTDKNGIREVYMIKTNLENEYYILENRQQKGWDEFLPGHGMLVWHIDYNETVWTGNVVNNSPSHQYVDIVEADNDISYYSIPGDVFPGTAGVTSFTDATAPSMKTWAGVSLFSPITDIKESEAGIISFVFKGGVDFFDAVVAQEATNIEADKATFAWNTVSQANSYLLSVYTKAANGDITYVNGYNRIDVGNVSTCDVDGLQPLTTYYYVVYATDGMFTSKASNEVEFTTADPTLNFKSVVALDATDVFETGFTANWQKLDDADSYKLTIYTSQLGAPDYETLDFTGKLEALPANWSTSCTGTYGLSGMCGEATPSLKMDADNAYLQSPVYSKGVRTISFWYRGSNAATTNSLKIYALNGSEWEEVKTISPVLNDAGGQTVSFDVDRKYTSIKWVYSRPGTGNVAIDDIKIGYGGKMEELPIAGYTGLEVGNVDSYVVEGLEAYGLYAYDVVGYNSEYTSKAGNRISVKLEASGISDIEVDSNVSCKVVGESIVVSLGENREMVSVYDCYGRVLLAKEQDGGVGQYTVNASGIIIVKVGNRVFKVVK